MTCRELVEFPIGYHLAAGPVEGDRGARNETAPGGIEGTPTIHVQLREKKVRVALDWTLDLCFAKDFACVTDGQGTRAPAAAARGLQAEAS